MTQVHETNTYTQLLAHAKRYRPRRGAELEILVHVRRLLVLGVETAHRTGGRDGIRNERELTNIGALLARYVAESAAATGVDLSRAHVGVDSLFCRELVWWWVASMSGVPAGTKRTYGPRLAAVSRWLGHEHWGYAHYTPPTLQPAVLSRPTTYLSPQQLDTVFRWSTTISTTARKRNVVATIALSFGLGLPLSTIRTIEGSDIEPHGA
ncbi:hypothetical protein [Corynebacterium pseudodiphtheriticum]|uniref:hypothetical protein n=1 Tax=Corynebacterium pseudodiphtheriticum TaxID=37637 RepID=UPI00255150FA|nr:hypothetical protein [Corynebacterium pseudodiphtheriticum]MDK8563250.1 hypothetical protein [Corynebacterium pseudodiphtheriticum]